MHIFTKPLTRNKTVKAKNENLESPFMITVCTRSGIDRVKARDQSPKYILFCMFGIPCHYLYISFKYDFWKDRDIASLNPEKYAHTYGKGHTRNPSLT